MKEPIRTAVASVVVLACILAAMSFATYSLRAQSAAERVQALELKVATMTVRVDRLDRMEAKLDAVNDQMTFIRGGIACIFGLLSLGGIGYILEKRGKRRSG